MPKMKIKGTEEKVKSVPQKTGRRKTTRIYNECRNLVKLGLSAAQQNSARNAKETTDGQQEGQYVVSFEVGNQVDIKALLGEILQIISIIQNLIQGKSKRKDNNINVGDIDNSGSSNGPNSPVTNITFVVNFNFYTGEQK